MLALGEQPGQGELGDGDALGRGQPAESRGIAGARIDRIARAAQTSKERVYAYFSSKVALYRFVSAQELAAVTEATRMDPTDLPGYAGRLHDCFTDPPDRFRLISWGQLELDAGDSLPYDSFRETVAHKVEQLRQAQETGRLDAHWDPVDILVFVHQIATAWAAQPDLLPTDDEGRATFLAARRAAIITAVERLFPATTKH